MCNSTESSIFSDFKSDLSKVIRVGTLCMGSYYVPNIVITMYYRNLEFGRYVMYGELLVKGTKSLGTRVGAQRMQHQIKYVIALDNQSKSTVTKARLLTC